MSVGWGEQQATTENIYTKWMNMDFQCLLLANAVFLHCFIAMRYSSTENWEPWLNYPHQSPRQDA